MESIVNEKLIIPTICLNMIVKNESKIIIRLLESVLPIIDSYCICDTGSTDNTIELITCFFEKNNISGSILHEPFINFEHNRNVALQHAYKTQANYILLLDADMCLNIKNFKKESLLKYDFFHIFQGTEDFYYKNIRIIKNNGVFKYIGVTHEFLSYPKDKKNNIIDKNSLFIKDYRDGGSKVNKFQRDIQLLSKGIEDEPNNVRYHFYLANSYHDTGQYEKAIEYYKKRIELGGWFQEQWYSAYKIGKCYNCLKDIEKAIYYWLYAYEIYPKRVENLYEIIHYYRLNKKYKQALLFYNIAKNITNTTNKEKDNFLFLQNDIYVYKLDYEYSIFAHYNGIKNINDELINIFNCCTKTNLTNELLKNMKFYRNILNPLIQYNFNSELVNFNASSSCLIKNPFEEGYIMNQSYLKCDYSNCDGHMVTLNKYIKLTNNFEIIEETLFDLHNCGSQQCEEENRVHLGIEDIKIFYNTNENNILFIGTIMKQDGKLGLCNGVYDININSLVTNEVTNSHNRDCEKNGVCTIINNKIYIIYEWFPLTVCELNENNIIKTNHNLPKIFKNFKGSTCGYNFNSEIWFIVQLVSSESPLNYYHLFVVLDENFNLLRYSAPFNFEVDSIERCLSLIVNNKVTINYSTFDKTTKISLYDKKYIDSLLIYK
jgi:tetratricopeptide (TPR) repeat protein